MGQFTFKTFALALSLCFLACFDNTFSTTNGKAYKFTYNGFEKRLNYGESKPYALVFLTKDCGVCKEQIRILNESTPLYAIEFFAVLRDAKNKEDAQIWAESKDLTLPLFYEQRASEFFSRAVGGVWGVPAIVFFDEKGILSKKFSGLTPQSVLSKELAKMNLTFKKDR